MIRFPFKSCFTTYRNRVRDCQGIYGTKCGTPRKPDGAVSEKITATKAVSENFTAGASR